jgi:hypothetical protein
MHINHALYPVQQQQQQRGSAVAGSGSGSSGGTARLTTATAMQPSFHRHQLDRHFPPS